MKRLQSKIRKACEMYNLIASGDRIACGVSGGKDSLALLVGLCEYRRYADTHFDLTAISLDPCFNNKQADYSKITALCENYGIEHVIKRTNLAEIIFDLRKEKNPCSLCARMRRGALHDLCKEHLCNKIALGHHMNDAVETFYMNLFQEGRIAAFSPISYLSRKELYMIRPLILCEESEIANAVSRSGLPVLKSNCPMDGVSERQRTKEFVSQKEREYPGFLNRTFTAMQSGNVSGLGANSENNG
ncbi:MAG: ATP-binding protein [Oscillospiraceae bacterium]